MGSPKVKVKAQVLIQHLDKVLVYRVLDEKTGTHIYRLIGGHIEFGELSEKAAIREFFEETHIEVRSVKHLGCFESLFTLHGKQKHEFVQIYACEFIDQSHYNKVRIKLFEPGEILIDAEWVDVKLLSEKSTPFYPEKLKEALADKLLENKTV
ncbi:MAG: NUDIX domain-containing protein [Bdellovibrionota bacterium]